jgi:hypothetical protein
LTAASRRTAAAKKTIADNAMTMMAGVAAAASDRGRQHRAAIPVTLLYDRSISFEGDAGNASERAGFGHTRHAATFCGGAA